MLGHSIHTSTFKIGMGQVMGPLFSIKNSGIQGTGRIDIGYIQYELETNCMPLPSLTCFFQFWLSQNRNRWSDYFCRVCTFLGGGGGGQSVLSCRQDLA